MDASAIGKAMDSTSKEQIGLSARQKQSASSPASRNLSAKQLQERRWLEDTGNNGKEAETSQGHNRHSGRKGDGIKPGRKTGARGTGAEPASFQQP